MGTIVVATDGSRAAGAALDEAIELARATGDQISVITVWRALQGDYGLAYPSAALLHELLDAEREHAERALDEGRRRADAAGIRATTSLTTGDPAEEICRHAAEVEARLIAMGSHGYGAVMSLLVGSVSSAVIQHAPCPVLVLPAAALPGEPEEHGEVAAAG